MEDPKKRSDEDEILFADEDANAAADTNPWRVLIVDDDEEVHQVSRLALTDFRFDGRSLEFLDAYSGREAVGVLTEHPDVALILMDVVMESDDAGLRAVETIRTKMRNPFVRIVLRTGQPGQAPEREVIQRYDINDYKEKTELTSVKMFTLVYSALAQYRDLMALHASRSGMERLAGASNTVFRRRNPERLSRGILEVAASLLGLAPTLPAQFGGLMLRESDLGPAQVMAGTGRYCTANVEPPPGKLLADLRQRAFALIGDENWGASRTMVAARLRGNGGERFLLTLEADAGFPPPEPMLMEMFCRAITTALHSAHLHDQLSSTQRELIVMLSEAIEKRSRETGNHVRRVGEFCRLLGQLCGLDEEQASMLLIAAPLHDAGKIAIPDAILNKPAKLTEAEYEIMKTHAQIGGHIFEGHDLPVLKAAAVIAAQHHERWDGRGYPAGLAGNGIHIYGRIAAIADVFDALASERCYKRAWPVEDVVKLIRDESGKHFDPQLVELVLDNLDRFIEIRDRYADPVDDSAAA